MASKLTYYYEMYRRVHLLRAAPKILNYMRYRCLTRKAKMSGSSVYPANRCLDGYLAL